MKTKRGQILKDLRKSKGLNQTYLSEMLGISLTAYQKYEHGTAEPNFDNLCKLADFYEVTTDYLLGREPKTNPIAMLNLDIPEGNVVERFVQLPSDMRKAVLDVMIKLADAAKGNGDNPSAGESEANDYEVDLYSCGDVEDANAKKGAG